ncbi:alcohol dehydrogenase catalytic domain-containing protein [Halorubrum sp. CSM-61]|uniref:alcohol dehydrogenase catalytic domain-containing protein n=1 Tax=Halorubrum sp. CSM-61 TaxID=2485838 RepID=UPI000F4CA0D2|nr:alcohol dehydrogenase catalytic domain-containing protein [Halorubrum sp. CSM-61]
MVGHESAGTVVEVGQNVTDIASSDRVAIEPGIPCREYQYCTTEGNTTSVSGWSIYPCRRLTAH